MRLTILFIVVRLILVNQLYSENCGEVTNCPLKRYNYYVCDSHTNTLIDMCLENPLAYISPTRHVMKNKFPICLDFKTSSLDLTTVTVPLIDEEVPPLVVFHKDLLENDLLNAQKEYMCLCGYKDMPCACTVKVEFTDDYRKLGLPNRYGLDSRIGYASYTYFYDDCKMDCSKCKIYLNGSSEFRQTPESVLIKKSFSNQEYFKDNPEYASKIKPGYMTFNLTTILAHELAHIYGIPHQMSATGSECSPPYDGELLNYSSYPNRAYVGMSNDDKCLFKKLYCPHLTPIEEMLADNSIPRLYPNPTNNILTFEQESPVPFQIIDFMGNTVLRDDSMQLVNKIDISSYPSGVYFITCNNTIFKFIKN